MDTLVSDFGLSTLVEASREAFGGNADDRRGPVNQLFVLQ